MGHAFHSEPVRRRSPPEWRRRSQRRWVRGNDHLAAVTLLAVLPSLPRATLSRLTTRMIDRMDEIDGDADLEPTGDERDASWREWHRLPAIFQQCGTPDEDALTLEDDEDPHDAEQEQAHD